VSAGTIPPIAVGGRNVTPAISELARRPAWVCWRATRRHEKVTKVPVTPAGSAASSIDPRTWSSFDECWAAAYAAGSAHGIGRVLVEGEELVAVDLDDAYALDGAGAPGANWARTIVSDFASYAEVSPSGSGLHVWGRGTWPTAGNRRGLVEVYAARRFLTVTGAHVAGAPDRILRCEEALERLWHAHFAGRVHANGGSARSGGGILEDFEAIEPVSADRLHRLAARMPQLRRILEGSYPSDSERDLALCRFGRLAG
jgi:primase-polymerase (primpol)-like protein